MYINIHFELLKCYIIETIILEIYVSNSKKNFNFKIIFV